MENYKRILSNKRFRESSIKRVNLIDDFYSDRSRILYSTSFRRLQQKAQVFSLEPNSSVRTRLTHSLEVSDLGRSIANKIAYKLSQNNILSVKDIPVFVSIVENACLLHDIGNPPFGHFGESAIRNWANSINSQFLPENVSWNKELEKLLMDFKEFDGNPQGFRTVTKLHTDYDKYSLNLTYATLLCMIKYARAAGEKKGEGILKKAGYFISEKQEVEDMYKETAIKLGRRFPLTYIMEAADDIAYCMSDIADGIEKGIFSEKEFISEFKSEWSKLYGEKPLPEEISCINEMKGFSRDISVPLSKKAIDAATDFYITNHQQVFEGKINGIIEQNSEVGNIFTTIKSVSRRILYTSFEAESIELSGYAVISGILTHYEKLLKLTAEEFQSLIEMKETEKNFAVERRLFNRLGKRCVEAYKYAIEKYKDCCNSNSYEWWLRIHLIIDHISGMTDEFALETYQMLEGINILR